MSDDNSIGGPWYANVIAQQQCTQQGHVSCDFGPNADHNDRVLRAAYGPVPDNHFDPDEVTHWMPLPEPPK